MRVNLKAVQPEDHFVGDVVFDAVPGRSKIRVWNNPLKAGSPIELPATFQTPGGFGSSGKDLWIEGIESSADARDITLLMQKGFQDEIRLTVGYVDSICLNSGNAEETPICYDGGDDDVESPCTSTGAEPSLIIPHHRVRSESDPNVIRDYIVGLRAYLHEGLNLEDLPIEAQQGDKWFKVSGPDSGFCRRIWRVHSV